MIRRPPRSTLDRSSAASDVYKRQQLQQLPRQGVGAARRAERGGGDGGQSGLERCGGPVSYTHLRAHETVLDLVCRLLLEKKNISTVERFIDNYIATNITPIVAMESITLPGLSRKHFSMTL